MSTKHSYVTPLLDHLIENRPIFDAKMRGDVLKATKATTSAQQSARACIGESTDHRPMHLSSRFSLAMVPFLICDHSRD